MICLKKRININKFNNYKANTIKFFDKMSEKNHGDSFKHYNNVIKWIKKINVNSILDVGTGRGDLLKLIQKNILREENNTASEVPNKSDIKLYGVDISPKMIEKAKLDSRDIEFSVGDSESVQYSDNFVQLVTCINSFHHYDNPLKSMEEIGRVVETGGYLIIGEIYLPNFVRKMVNKLLPYGQTGDYKIYSCEELEKIAEKAGFFLLEKKYVFPSNYTYFFKKK